MDSLHLIMAIRRLNLQNRLCIDQDMASSILACCWCISTPDLPVVVDLLVLKFEIGAIRSKIVTPSNPSMRTQSTAANRSLEVRPSTFVLRPTCFVRLMLSDAPPVFEVNFTHFAPLLITMMDDMTSKQKVMDTKMHNKTYLSQSQLTHFFFLLFILTLYSLHCKREDS